MAEMGPPGPWGGPSGPVSFIGIIIIVILIYSCAFASVFHNQDSEYENPTTGQTQIIEDPGA